MKFALFLAAVLIPAVTLAKPSAEEVKNVINYYHNGKDQGVVLADLKLCDSIGTEGELKNECQGERDAANLTVGEAVNVWMTFMVPAGLDQQEVMLQLNHQGVTRGVEKATVGSSFRYRVWRKVKLDRAGEWTASIMHENGQNMETLREVRLRVQPK